MRLVPCLALLLLNLGMPGTLRAEATDFCRSSCFSEKTVCRNNAEQARNDTGGGPAVAAAIVAAMAAKQQPQAEIQASNNADWHTATQQGRRDEQASQRSEGYLACDSKFSQCVEACRH